ncbi:hypothetical protein AAE478_002116 [Parahypoxylon ruwenzoriense]
MDRSSPSTSGVLAAKPNGNTNSDSLKNPTRQLFGSRRTPRKDSTKPESKENIASDTDASTGANSRHPLYSGPRYIRHSSSLSASTHRASESPRETRIPRPKSTAPGISSPSPQNKQGQSPQLPVDMRQPMSFRSAFELAQKQDADEQLDDTFNIQQAFRIASAEMNGRIQGSPSPAPRNSHLKRESYSAIPQRPLTNRSNNDDLGRHLQQFDRTHQLSTGNKPQNSLFNKTRLGPKVLETGDVVPRRVSDGNLGVSPARRRISQVEADPRKKDLAAGPANRGNAGGSIPIPTIEYESASDGRVSPINRPLHLSPEKSYNWQLDADFTAGDLQVSNSPRIQTSHSNGVSSRRPPSVTSSPASGTPNSRRGNHRLDQIRQKEIEAANAVISEDDPPLHKRVNSRLDELRAREREALSKRSVATSRLDEIRIRNSEARSESPETGRGSNRESLRGGSLQIENEPTKTPEIQTMSGLERGQVPDTPVTIFRSTSDQKPSEASKDGRGEPKAEDGKRDARLPRNDSQDLLRRLARATSNSPPAEKTEQQAVSNESPPRGEPRVRADSRPRLTREERKSKNLEVKGSRERPTVGFAGLRRGLSSDSIREKRASRPGSEADPTDRIEAEMKLFAPLDNYSEKGSVRALSPNPSEPYEEETPRATRFDPLTQPTPRVTGAYIETPATIKVVKHESDLDDKPALDDPSKKSGTIPELRSRSSSEPLKEEGVKQQGDDAKASGGTSKSRSSSAPTSSRRARSASRRRRPLRPLINTAKPPSVKDDIRAILRMNQIDDSTLDDFDTILADHQINDEELEQMVNDTMDKIDNDLELPGLSERDRELQIYDRMSKSLKTGLLGIRSAKKGIERLEDKVMHTEHKAGQIHTDLNTSSTKPRTHVPANLDNSGPVLISIPALYRKSPKFRLTKFGLLTLLILIWYIIESIFCFLYAAPQYDCTPDLPCDWSPNEPYFPYTTPFMLDEWATGGKGRELTWWIGEEVGDILADVSDWVTNTDFTQFDQKYMNVWERKRHRRRLRKHGLIPQWVRPPHYNARFPEWNSARRAEEATEELEYEAEDEMMSADERVR